MYHPESTDKAEPCGSQDMIGLIYSGIKRLEYDIRHDGGVFPTRIESCNNPKVARWLEKVLYLLPTESRPDGYNPLEEKMLDPKWIAKLGKDI